MTPKEVNYIELLQLGIGCQPTLRLYKRTLRRYIYSWNLLVNIKRHSNERKKTREEVAKAKAKAIPHMCMSCHYWQEIGAASITEFLTSLATGICENKLSVRHNYVRPGDGTCAVWKVNERKVTNAD